MKREYISGAKWWKFDFHVHTPKSNDYGKGETDAVKLEALKEKSAREFLLEYMYKEIDCISITDHNNGEWIDILKDEYEIMKSENINGFREIYIFPGFEVNVNGNIHLLGLFDLAKTTSEIQAILGESTYKGELEATEKGISHVMNCIINNGGIAIPAHVDMPSGLFYKEDAASTVKLALSVDGLISMEIDNPAEFSNQIYNETKLNLSKVIGSDGHHPDKIGTKYTWVKMEQPCIEALKLALHDSIDGVKRYDEIDYNPNEFGNRFYIKKIIIKKGSKAGRATPLEVDFSPWMTSIIGGRGSGKSSILEYMRIVTDRCDELPDKIKKDFNEFKKIHSRGQTGMLTVDTEIVLELYKNGDNISLTWKNNIITERLLDKDGLILEEKNAVDIKKRFPVRLFSQKELYEMTEDTGEVMRLMDEQWDKQSWLDKNNELETEFLNSSRIAREVKNKLSKKESILQGLKDLESKMKILENEQTKNILEKYNKKEIEKHKLSIVNNEVGKFIDEISQTFEKVNNIQIDIDFIKEFGCDSELIVKNKIDEFNAFKNNVLFLKDSLLKYKADLKDTLNSLPWVNEYNKSRKEYEVLASELKQAGVNNIDEYDKLIEGRKILQEQNMKIVEEEKNLKEQIEKTGELYTKIINHQKLLEIKRSEIINKWNSSQEIIKVELDLMGNDESSEKTLRELLRKSNGEYSKYICDREDGILVGGIINDIKCSSYENKWNTREEIIDSLIKLDESKYSKMFINHISKVSEEWPEHLDKLKIWMPEDRINLKLINGKKEEEIETGSAGQRTSALLGLILALGDAPLIIDQPEDDLDTKNISDLIVKGLLSLKQYQQSIVITHNPNIPVNACSEQIVEMAFKAGNIQVSSSGALQNYEIRDAICEVMEGGKDALDKRYYRIFKALSRKIS